MQHSVDSLKGATHTTLHYLKTQHTKQYKQNKNHMMCLYILGLAELRGVKNTG